MKQLSRIGRNFGRGGKIVEWREKGGGKEVWKEGARMRKKEKRRWKKDISKDQVFLVW